MPASYASPLQRAEPNHYATLGLDHRCTDAQIRAAYRVLAKQHHPDLNGGSRDAVTRTQALNAAYEILSDPAQRQAHDRELAAPKKTATRSTKSQPNISQDVHLRFEEFLYGTTLEVRVNDPGLADGPELYPLVIPPATAPGTRFRVARTAGGFVLVKARVRPGFHFKARGSDLRCDLKISSQRAKQGGTESVRGVGGNFLRVQIPAGVTRGEIIRLTGEGLPKPRGGRGDLLVRITYRPEVRIARTSKR